MLSPIKKTLLVLGGVLSLLLGVVGAFLPLLPTVPLVLLAAFCFARSSDRLHNWLLTHPVFGRIVRDFESGQGVERRIKVRAIVLIWLSMGLSCWIMGRAVVCFVLAIIGIGVTANIWRLPEPVRPTLEKGTGEEAERRD